MSICSNNDKFSLAKGNILLKAVEEEPGLRDFGSKITEGNSLFETYDKKLIPEPP